MGKFLIGLVTGILLTILGAVAVLLLVVHYSQKPPDVAANSVLVMRLSGEIPEKPGLDMPSFLGDEAAPTISNIWMALRKAAVDSHIRAIVLEPDGLSIGWSRLEELRSDIEKFRKSGKPVYAYLRNPTAREYYVALAADRIYLGPSETFMLKGMHAELMYFHKTLDKLGVTIEVEHAGKYKDFGDMFTRDNMSPETQEVINSIVDGLYGNLVDRIASARHKSSDDVRGIIDRGPFTAKQALAAGLVDQLSFEDQMWGDVKDKLNVQPKHMSLADYVKVPPENVGLGGKRKIAMVVGEGDIVRGSPSNDGSGEAALTSYGFDKVLRDVGGDSSIKGVVVRINSPGGEVMASDEM